MRILIYSSVFPPSVGGLESMARMLAEEFTALGHSVVMVTLTEAREHVVFPFSVLRRPKWREALAAAKAADVVLHMNLSLKALWLPMLALRPLVIGHYGQYRRIDGRIGLRDRLKYWVSNHARNIACSGAVKHDLPVESVVIGNAYEDGIFTMLPGARERDLIFVGRLVSEKGVDILLGAVEALAQANYRPSLTVVGVGPEESRLQDICNARGLSDQVTFAGKCLGRDLVDLINKHRVMVVPSRNEGFGIVALEGIACGCTVVGSDAGGLPEAIGKCGITHRNGDMADLARALKEALSDSAVKARCDLARASHLARFARREVARRYLAVLDEVVQGTRTV